MDFIRIKLQQADVVAMVSGDPGYYSLLDALRREFPAEQLTVIPGISAMQYAFARLALPWHDATLASFHGRTPSAEEIAYKPGKILGLLTDSQHNSQTIAQILMKAGWPSEQPLHICSRLSYEDEEIITTTLQEAETLPLYNHCILVAGNMS
jgi:cobalt-precorrin-7 (C5)-methyltransferase